MRFLIERVKSAKCVIDNKIYSEISHGFLVYVAYENGDTFLTIDKGLEKIKKLRIFTDSQGKLNLSIDQVNGSVLLISSFSLFANLMTGNRPTFSRSIPFNESKPLFDYTIEKAKTLFNLEHGVFGADMEIEAINDGPISVILDLN